jgi:hypothetical protein
MRLVEHGSEGDLWVVLSPILPKWFTHQDTYTHQNQHLNLQRRNQKSLERGKLSFLPGRLLIMKLAA